MSINTNATAGTLFKLTIQSLLVATIFQQTAAAANLQSLYEQARQQDPYIAEARARFDATHTRIEQVGTLSLAMGYMDDELWRRVGREPSGSRFNSLVQLEYEKGIPRNPLINAGAIVICDVLVSNLDNPKQALLDYMRVLSGSYDLTFDEEVARSEKATGFINRALANFLKGHGNLDNDVDEVLDLYFHQCALAMSCTELARASLHLANRGVSSELEEALLSPRQVKRLNAVMMTCGLYDAVGEFAFRVGLPAKSGVGGGIIAVLPGEYSVAVWSPELDSSGNSLVGGAALEYITTVTGRSVF